VRALVGATFAYALASSGLTDEIVLIDQNESLAQGQVLDLVHGQPFFPHRVHPCRPSSGLHRRAAESFSPSSTTKGATCFAVGLALVAPKQFCRIECSKVVWSNKGTWRASFLWHWKQGWQGRIYEDFEVGDIYQHPIGRTITQTRQHLVYASQTEFKRTIMVYRRGHVPQHSRPLPAP